MILLGINSSSPGQRTTHSITEPQGVEPTDSRAMSGLMATLPAWGLIPADPSAPSSFSPADSRGQVQILSKPGSSHKICPLVLPSTLCILESEHLASTLLIFVELMNAGVNEEISGTCTALSTFHINYRIHYPILFLGFPCECRTRIPALQLGKLRPREMTVPHR